ncbi:uncharacterized protein B0I36DRAFT_70691 [Microdochium trichocladiopsis]|uniref:Uncharacterized protein n=1 Tax=Microdochium trichocladiopsis TaxID=1682393 RepID=A0A9P9BUS4_9PEZI|nr:uncharacterized protein B0I36DRAFT_70691 [Microdochium trichocladiopsis]KAH7037769.1 hypothetical protein B0I36DRAFT_70691 [Microdochium trichocladiopsis]
MPSSPLAMVAYRLCIASSANFARAVQGRAAIGADWTKLLSVRPMSNGRATGRTNPQCGALVTARALLVGLSRSVTHTRSRCVTKTILAIPMRLYHSDTLPGTLIPLYSKSKMRGLTSLDWGVVCEFFCDRRTIAALWVGNICSYACQCQ